MRWHLNAHGVEVSAARCCAGFGIAMAVVTAGCEPSRASAPAGSDGETAPAQVVTVSRIAQSSDEALFSRIMALDVDSKGQVYVADWDVPAITILSPGGNIARVLGRRGSGPGEFQNVASVQVLGGDSVVVFDRGLARITVFDPYATVAYQVNLADGSRKFPIRVWRLRNQGQFLATYSDAYTTRDTRKDDRSRMQVARLLDPHGRVVRDSVLAFRDQENLVARAWGALAVAPHPFGRRGELALGADDRIYYGSNDTVGVQRFSESGVRLGGFVRPHRAVPITSGDVARAEAPLSRNLQRALSESLPRTWPAFRGLVVGDSSLVWLGRVGPGGVVQRWDAFETGGSIARSAVFPRNFELHAVRNGVAYGVQKDELDVPRVVWFRITPNANPPPP